MSRRQLVTAVLATGCLLVPSVGAGASLPALHASTAAHKHAHKRHAHAAALPLIKRVKPRKLAIGGTLTVVGRNFLPGRRRNTVVFFRKGAPAIFLRAGRSTKTRMKVKLTSKLGRYLVARNTGERAPTRFRLRVLARRFGARFTPRKLSPVVLPAKTRSGGGKRTPARPRRRARWRPRPPRRRRTPTATG